MVSFDPCISDSEGRDGSFIVRRIVRSAVPRDQRSKNKTKEQVGEIGGNWGDKQNRKWT